MRLVIDGQRLGPGRTGVGRCLESLLDVWSRSGWPLDDVILALRDPRAVDRFTDRPGLQTRLVGPREPGLAWELVGLRRLLRRGDLLLAPANLSPPNWTGATVLIAYDTLPWATAGGLPRRALWQFGWRYRMAARRARRIVVPSRATAADVIRVHGCAPDRVTVVYPGPEPEFRPSPPHSPEIRGARDTLGLANHPYFLFVGKRSARRNVGAILSAFETLHAERPELRLVFVGPSGGEPLPGNGAGVIDGGHASEPVLRGLLADAVALLYPSNHEGFGLPVVEAQASGCPVVTLRNSALVESAGEAAYYLERPDAGSLIDAMRRLSDDRGFRATLVDRGLEHVRRFDRAAFADGLARLIREVAAGEPIQTDRT